MKKFMKPVGIFALTTTLLVTQSVFAGGGTDGGQGGTGSTEVLKTMLKPLNARQTLTGRQSGNAVVRIKGDRITVQIRASGLDPSIMHMAHIHKGDRCPSQTRDDANRDGVLDVIEGVPAYGPVLVNFGADISSLAASAKGGTPMANAAGVVNYKGSGSYSSLVNDLHDRAAMAPGTGIGKLAPGEDFMPEMGVIVVHGIRAQKSLPAGTQTLTGLTPQMSLPVLCGRLYRSANGVFVTELK